MADKDITRPPLVRRGLSRSASLVRTVFDESAPATRRVRAGAVGVAALTAGGVVIAGLADPALTGMAPLLIPLEHTLAPEVHEAGIATALGLAGSTVGLALALDVAGEQHLNARTARTRYVHFLRHVRTASVLTSATTGLVAGCVAALGGGHAAASVAEASAAAVGAGVGIQAAASLFGRGLPRTQRSPRAGVGE